MTPIIALVLAMLVMVFLGFVFGLSYVITKYLMFPLTGIIATDNQILEYTFYSLLLGILFQLLAGGVKLTINKK